ncbi:hypothetical protein NPS01_22470 [Nocardioides psychrotolerans]|uniref:Uncharacterized protein n=1 Tax=Nocardioides psychrotolerans TaxID=1005945 RepID=A0A1I3I6G3_9ACTN|nr:hypothetical protein [Nocardioides psychrotolerans]GEP38584.1 hypothetical protein NPS01_22470 [Nocardioides psychrotolerans]SFI43516.1 hypothetical protein SAMN05216561_108136 [Nocardioides psychrotolerans]
MAENYDPAQFMIENTFTAFELVTMVLEDRGDDLERALADLDLTRLPGVLRAAVALAAQEMTTARGADEALAYARSARPA